MPRVPLPPAVVKPSLRSQATLAWRPRASLRTRSVARLLSLCASSPGPRRTRTAPARPSEQYVRVVHDQALRVPRCASPSPPPSPSSLLDSPLQTAHYVIFVLPRLQACSTPLPTVSHDLARRPSHSLNTFPFHTLFPSVRTTNVVLAILCRSRPCHVNVCCPSMCCVTYI